MFKNKNQRERKIKSGPNDIFNAQLSGRDFSIVVVVFSLNKRNSIDIKRETRLIKQRRKKTEKCFLFGISKKDLSNSSSRLFLFSSSSLITKTDEKQKRRDIDERERENE